MSTYIQREVDVSSSMNFSFKCHRETPSAGIANVYSVNDISFHPTFGTFSTAGSDGTFHFWYVFSVALLPPQMPAPSPDTPNLT